MTTRNLRTALSKVAVTGLFVGALSAMAPAPANAATADLAAGEVTTMASCVKVTEGTFLGRAKVDVKNTCNVTVILRIVWKFAQDGSCMTIPVGETRTDISSRFAVYDYWDDDTC